MRPEQTEKIYVEEMFRKSCEKHSWPIDGNVSVNRLTGDASTRKYFRINNSKISFVACLDNPIDEPENDFIYVDKLLESKKVRVPRIYDYDLTRGYILEEDLGDETFIRNLSNVADVGEELQLYTNALDEIIKIHKINLEEITRTNIRNRYFDYEKLYSEIELSFKHFIFGLLNVNNSDERNFVLEKCFRQICKELEGYPNKVLCHRDYHSRNIMIKNGELVVIDFQDARIGAPFYDLVSLLEDCYYSIDESNIASLKKYYYGILKDHLGIKSSSDFDYYYDLSKLQRLFKAIGSFSFIHNTRDDKRYLKYIGFAMEKIKVTLMKMPEYSELRKALFSLYYER